MYIYRRRTSARLRSAAIKSRLTIMSYICTNCQVRFSLSLALSLCIYVQAQDICKPAKYKGKIVYHPKPSGYGRTGGGVAGRVLYMYMAHTQTHTYDII